MPNAPLILDCADDGVLDLLQESGTLKTWEYIRCSGKVVTVEEVGSKIGVESAELQRQIDRLVDHGLLRLVRARKPRTTVGYRATCDRIVVSFDENDQETIEAMMRSSERHVAEFEADLSEHAEPDFHTKSGYRFRHMSTHHFSQEDFAELRRRVLSVVSFLTMPRSPGRRGGGSGSDSIDEPRYCNQAISIALEPLAGDLLPLPVVITTPRSKLSDWDESQAAAGGIGTLSPREREVALALADGLTRSQIADRLGLSVNTVATLARRAYRKLDVSGQTELVLRLQGHDRPTPGRPED